MEFIILYIKILLHFHMKLKIIILITIILNVFSFNEHFKYNYSEEDNFCKENAKNCYFDAVNLCNIECNSFSFSIECTSSCIYEGFLHL